MNYELAKELRDAGFPQREMRYKDGVTSKYNEPIIYQPTLEELIEACGEDFNSLFKRPDGQWITECPDGHEEHICFGFTPTEAVARLWMALKKPNTPGEA
jgi:hypothetical protein